MGISPNRLLTVGSMQRSEADKIDLLGTLIRIAGKADALVLIEKFGGQRLFIPAQIGAQSRIRQVISAAAADALSAEFAGLSLKVPLARQWRIAVYRERGLSYAAIASAIGCTETAVWRHLRDMGLTASHAGPTPPPKPAPPVPEGPPACIL